MKFFTAKNQAFMSTGIQMVAMDGKNADMFNMYQLDNNRFKLLISENEKGSIIYSPQSYIIISWFGLL